MLQPIITIRLILLPIIRNNFDVNGLTDITIVSGIYTGNTITLINNTGGTVSITGITAGGGSSSDTYVTGRNNNNNKTYTFANNTGGTFVVNGLSWYLHVECYIYK